MTRAPESLLAPRRLLLDHLGPHGLVPVAVGIVGDPAHRGGYHCGSDRVDGDDYSVRESSRDRTGLTDDAAALDIGQFRVARAGQVYDLRHFSRWLAGECAKGAADTRDIREVIYSPDGRTVRRWDRLGRRSSGDRSHLAHTHISYFRDAIKAGRDQSPLFRRYLTSIGLIESEDIMASIDDLRRVIREEVGPAVVAADRVPAARPPHANSDYGDPAKASQGNKSWSLGYTLQTIAETGRATNAQVAAVRAELARLAGQDLVDEPAIVAGVLAGLTPEAIAAAIPADLAGRVVDELAARIGASAPAQG
ncbi:hypothetical protein [Micromonospora okii]|uniref:hypothetical protein n=1 Tax=Micromonospora okii TaxID=1182970 RepID=UPI001E29E807|nr:hypothetical protein [Micromonospora okii]